ncbi:MAG: c-type cytochrome [Hyphomicrobiales bacterium]|nr:c-type cytochrome [Hyphomicrobiales bacterium]
MSADRIDPKLGLAGVLFLATAFYLGTLVSSGPQPAATTPPATTHGGAAAKKLAEAAAAPAPSVAAVDARPVFVPLPMDKVPEDEFGKMARLGEAIFHDTRANAGAFVGNDLQCRNCHLDDGRHANSAPLWAAYLVYPAYRKKDHEVNTFQSRMQGCFRYSMNGKAPELGDKVLVALEAYAYAMAKGGPTGVAVAGQGYPRLAEPATLDAAHGKAVFAEKCAVCHGADGAGQNDASGQTTFPPLWGARSYNWGAGMASISNAAAFVKANMPLSQAGSLSDKDAWDVAAFIDSQERPQDPRFNGSVAETRKAFHDSKMDMYGQTVDGVTLGQNAPPSGATPKQQ